MMQPTFIWSLTAFALLHPSLGAEYPVPSAVSRPTPYREAQPSAIYSSLPTSQPEYTHHNGGPPCCRVVSKDGRCGASNGGATCLGSGFGNCCGPEGLCGGEVEQCGGGCDSNFGLCYLSDPWEEGYPGGFPIFSGGSSSLLSSATEVSSMDSLIMSASPTVDPNSLGLGLGGSESSSATSSPVSQVSSEASLIVTSTDMPSSLDLGLGGSITTLATVIPITSVDSSSSSGFSLSVSESFSLSDTSASSIVSASSTASGSEASSSGILSASSSELLSSSPTPTLSASLVTESSSAVSTSSDSTIVDPISAGDQSLSSSVIESSSTLVSSIDSASLSASSTDSASISASLSESATLSISSSGSSSISAIDVASEVAGALDSIIDSIQPTPTASIDLTSIVSELISLVDKTNAPTSPAASSSESGSATITGPASPTYTGNSAAFTIPTLMCIMLSTLVFGILLL
ncbi:hypothetical protein HBI26_028290 [Parastagonospora nodorum]|nr:hypothetical protein HBI26_028290 [Parastagonospora nodorum]KAH5720947.1 hypothetical protein HBI18_150970 [Parastagonospora nodorum]KAH6466004.1 hypothetical protein HBI57_027930 [Parastagonospora nodorum]